MFIDKLIQRLRLKRRKKMFVSKTTLLGSNHIFGVYSVASLLDGSSKENIIIQDGARIFGTLVSQNKGQITIGKNVRVGHNVTIQCVNSISIGDNTEIARDTYLKNGFKLGMKVSCKTGVFAISKYANIDMTDECSKKYLKIKR